MRSVALDIDDEALANRIASILADQAGVLVVDKDSPDVVITDRLPFRGGIPTIVVGEDLNAFGMLRAGASGVLFRDCRASDLTIAIEAAARGFAILPRELSGADEASKSAYEPPPGNLLTGRELEVLRLLAEGASNKLIARRLGISFHTAKFHVASIATKLDATGRTDAVAQAARLGLIML